MAETHDTTPVQAALRDTRAALTCVSHWTSEDGQGSYCMHLSGDCDEPRDCPTLAEAEAEMLGQCRDDVERAAVLSGTWEDV